MAGGEKVAQSRLRATPALVAAAVVFAAAYGGYAADVLAHHLWRMLTWFDFDVYVVAGQHVVEHSALLYSWRFAPGVRFVYTPFAALAFAVLAPLPYILRHGFITAISLAAIPLTTWLTLGGMGLRGRRRILPALVVSAVGLWTFPVIWSLHLGQVEPALMLLVVWDLTLSDRRWWKGAGVGLAAGIKLVPLIFIPYLLLAGKIRQALVATGTFAATILIGFVFLPGESYRWWLTGYMFQTSKNGSVVSLVDQSLLGMLTRLASGHSLAVRPAWLLIAGLIGLAGVIGAAVLHRSGRPVEGMLACAVTGLLVSPISWDNHWVWVVPLTAMLAGLAVRASGLARAGYVAAAAALVAAFGAWPTKFSGPGAFVPQRAFLGWFTQTGPRTYSEVYHLRGLQILTWNLYVVAGCLVLAVMLAAAWRLRHAVTWRSAARTERAGHAGQPSAAASSDGSARVA